MYHNRRKISPIWYGNYFAWILDTTVIYRWCDHFVFYNTIMFLKLNIIQLWYDFLMYTISFLYNIGRILRGLCNASPIQYRKFFVWGQNFSYIVCELFCMGYNAPRHGLPNANHDF